jgi:DNA-binding PadR family transcriptional regulator
MVRLIILYYLNIKATHGYEIQKYIQVAGFNRWANVKSGSIYYALNKMEKEGEVKLVKETIHGSRTRKIYEITDKGREELNKSIRGEMEKFLVPIGTEKYILPMFVDEITKDESDLIINKHIEKLNEQLKYWKYWRDVKITDGSTEVEKISFDMTISNIEYSIKWHKALLQEYEDYVNGAKKQHELIKCFDFCEMDTEIPNNENKEDSKKIINELKKIIVDNTNYSDEQLEELLKVLKNGKA